MKNILKMFLLDLPSKSNAKNNEKTQIFKKITTIESLLETIDFEASTLLSGGCFSFIWKLTKQWFFRSAGGIVHNPIIFHVFFMRFLSKQPKTAFRQASPDSGWGVKFFAILQENFEIYDLKIQKCMRFHFEL